MPDSDMDAAIRLEAATREAARDARARLEEAARTAIRREYEHLLAARDLESLRMADPERIREYEARADRLQLAMDDLPWRINQLLDS